MSRTWSSWAAGWRRYRREDPARGRLRRTRDPGREESHHPYLRPPLSKEFLLGKAGYDDRPVVPAGWNEVNGVELRLGIPAAQIHPADRAVTLRDGTRLE